MPLSGGCTCGAVRYDCDADPVFAVNCHCRDCQRATGSAYAAILIVPRTAVKVTGELRSFRTTGEAGSTVDRSFCGACGNPILSTLERIPNIVGLAAGSLDDPAIFKPAMDIFTESAQAWDHMHPDVPKRPRGTQG